MTELQSLLEDVHPIDLVESLAEDLCATGGGMWNYERCDENLIILAYAGVWAQYSLNAKLETDGKLVLYCAFDASWDDSRTLEFLRLINLFSSFALGAHFFLNEDRGHVILRTWIQVDQDGNVELDQVSAMIDYAVQLCEQFYPAFLAMGWDDTVQVAEEALQFVVEGSFGTA